MIRSTARRTFVCLAAVTLLTSACGSDTATSAADSAAATSSAAKSTSFPQMTIDVTDDEAKAGLEMLESALLTPEDLGEGFTRGSYVPADPNDHDSVLPCGQSNTAALFPNALRTGVTLNQGSTAQLQQSVNLFLNRTAADGAYLSAVNGYSCETADLGGITATIKDQGDVTAATGADAAHAWTATVGEERGVLFAVQLGNVTMTFTFVLAATTGDTDLPQPVEIVRTAVSRMRQAGL